MSAPRILNFINNQDVAPAAGAVTFQHRNPANQSEVVYELGFSSLADVDAAIAAARTAFDAGVWSNMATKDRNAILSRACNLIRERAPAIAAALCAETGRVMPLCGLEVPQITESLEYNMALALTTNGECNTTWNPAQTTLILNEPVGVVGCIIPWNYPIMLLGQKIAPALCAGCTVVAKPSEFTASTAIMIAHCFRDAGLPAGVLNMVFGGGPEVGGRISSSMHIDMVSFTGSTATAKLVMQSAAQSNMKKVALEAGGKSANIIMPDANIDAVVGNPFFLLSCALLHSGQVCAVGSRLFVHESIKDEFFAKLTQAFRNFHVLTHPASGEGFPFCTGAITFRGQFDKIMELIESGKSQGATLACGGERLVADGKDQGLFVAPTIFTNVTPEMRIYKEEIFGPVMCCSSYKDIDEAVRLANATEFGLAAMIWGTDVGQALNVAKRLQAGFVAINGFGAPGPHQPFGGYKQSGLGRENGRVGFMEYFETKTISF